MSLVPRIRRPLWFALAAIAASLPGTTGASTGPRCEAMPAGCTTCSCCEDGSAASTQPGPISALRPASESRPIGLGCPISSSPCVCRAPQPVAPAQKPGQREEERRVETGREVAADSLSYAGPRVPVAIAFMPNVGPPRSPIYLRTARLLI
jgi:hypothetical protein